MQTGKPFTAENLRKIDSIPVNFIVGKERSGTTLLQLMLNAHPNIIAPPESKFIILLYFKFGKIQKWTEKIIINFCNRLFREMIFRKFWGIDKQELQSALIGVKELLSFPLVCKMIFFFSSPEKKEVHIFFDKNPLYYYFLPELNTIFPEAKYIHLVRDYRANLVSHQKVFLVKKVTDITYRWLKVNMLIEEIKSHSPQKYFTLTYESLVNNPSQKMQDLCLFLNLPYNINMVQNHRSGMYSNFIATTGEGFRKVHENVFHAINPALISEWENTISTEDLIKAESIAGNYGERMYGYKLKCPENTIKINGTDYFIMELKYKLIRAFFRINLSNHWVNRIFRTSVRIKRKIWKIFK